MWKKKNTWLSSASNGGTYSASVSGEDSWIGAFSSFRRFLWEFNSEKSIDSEDDMAPERADLNTDTLCFLLTISSLYS